MANEHDVAVLVLLVGAIVVLAALSRAALQRLRMPDIVGYIVIGVALSAIDHSFALTTSIVREGIEAFAGVGVVLLLFRVGLESRPARLLRQLPRASVTLVGDVVPSALFGYVAARYACGTDVLPALFVAVALAATSAGVALSVWRDDRAIDTNNGALLTDVAELDDMVGVILVAVLLALAPAMRNGEADDALWLIAAPLLGWLLLKLTGLIALCLAFMRYAEEGLTRWLARIDRNHVPALPIAGVGFIIAAITGWLGFSLPIGAALAGLAFSRDPQRVRIDRAFDSLYQFFVPFFFVAIGFHIDVTVMADALVFGIILLVVAIVAKVAGAGLPVLLTSSPIEGLLIGTSLVPRAEITMIVMDRGRALGAWAVPGEIYGGMVFVALASCVLTPPVVRYLLRRFPQGGQS